MSRVLLLMLALAAHAPAQPKVDPHGDPLPDGAVFRFGTVRDNVGRAYHPASPSPRRSVALSPDGKTLAAERPDGIAFWDVDTGRVTRRLPCRAAQAESPPRFALAYSPDGKVLARVGGRVVSVFDLNTGKPVFETDCRREGPFEDIAFLPGGDQLVVTTARYQRMHTLDARTGKVVRTAQLTEEHYALIPAGRFVAGRTKPGWVLYDGATLKEHVRFLARSDGTERLQPDPDGKRVWVSAETGQVRAVDTETGKTLQELPAPPSGTEVGRRFAFSPDRGVVYRRPPTWWLTDDGERVDRYDIRAGRWLPPFKDVRGGEVMPHPDGKRLLVLGYDGILHRHDVATGKRLPGADGFEDHVNASVSPDGRRVVIESGWGVERKRLDLFELTGRHVWTVHPKGQHGRPQWAPDGRTLVCDGREAITLRDAATGRVTRTLAIPNPKQRYDVVDPFLPGGNRLMLYFKDGFVVLDLGGAAPPEQIPWKEFGRIGLSPDGRIVACDGLSEGLRLVDLATTKVLTRVKAPGIFERRQPDHDAVPRFSPDGCYLLTWDKELDRRRMGADRSFAVLRDPATLAVKHQFETGKREVSAFSPDGLRLAVGSIDGSWSLWDVPTGTRLGRWEGHGDKVTSIGFAGPGRVVTGSEDLTALVWDLRPKEAPVGPAWDALGGDNTREAYRAVWALAADPRGPDVLREKVPVVPAAAVEKARQWIADLGADRFAVREAATRGLEGLGRLAEPELRAARERAAIEEVRTRADGLLAKIPRERVGNEVVQARAVLAMELAGTEAARKVLVEWAAGAPGAQLTRDAKAALDRLAATR